MHRVVLKRVASTMVSAMGLWISMAKLRLVGMGQGFVSARFGHMA